MIKKITLDIQLEKGFETMVFDAEYELTHEAMLEQMNFASERIKKEFYVVGKPVFCYQNVDGLLIAGLSFYFATDIAKDLNDCGVIS